MKQEVICSTFFCPGMSQMCQEKGVLGLLRNCLSKLGTTALHSILGQGTEGFPEGSTLRNKRMYVVFFFLESPLIMQG
jgi:hypothetical protein